MTFNDDADIRGGRVSRRGRNVAIGAGLGGGGIVVVAVVLIAQLFGVDLSGVVPTTGSVPDSSATALNQCATGAQANDDMDCRMQAAATSLDAYWADTLGSTYTQPQLALFDGATSTGCGAATADVGPFYCPNDETVYIDTAFYDELRSRFGASGGPLAQLYVVAHEWGHHIQNITGITDGLDLRASGPTSDSVRLELQADCLAGSWVAGASHTTDEHGTPFLKPPTTAQVSDALNAAAAVGDDRIQSTLGSGQVDPESFTHGTSAQRDRWFSEGYDEQTGGRVQCDTFGVSGREL
ncbi:neutral zinc metallopeptidase [Pseudolysinimonas kribbensis]|uniref:Membrane protein n=1 Tax=Pseudolysinimonas kribbensis TaxID=433641 RepID=A0ABQ6K6H5_9MICO|nr:neutral zinc metallopeptidase [Pseudolysinimonas kribbensis]GMA95341.1 membrane protein [Pseudolysinimonas kribbensis]